MSVSFDKSRAADKKMKDPKGEDRPLSVYPYSDSGDGISVQGRIVRPFPELSPRDKGFARHACGMRDRMESGEVRVSDPTQRWCLEHRLVLFGSPDTIADSRAAEYMLGTGEGE